jgi:hypothetical protein
MTLATGYHLRPSVGNVHQLVSIAEQNTLVIPASVPGSLAELLKEAPEILPGGQHAKKPAHRVEHAIETSGRPVFAKARRLDPIKLHIA